MCEARGLFLSVIPVEYTLLVKSTVLSYDCHMKSEKNSVIPLVVSIFKIVVYTVSMINCIISRCMFSIWLFFM